MDSDSATEYIGIINKKIDKADYSDANLLVRQIGRRIASKSVGKDGTTLGHKKMDSKEKSFMEEFGFKKFEPYLEDVSINKLKEKAELLNEEIHNITDTIKNGRFRSKLPPPKLAKPLYDLEKEETSATTKINRMDFVERLSSLKKPVYANLIKLDDQRKLLALTRINTELQIYSLVAEGKELKFVDIFRYNMETLVIDLVFGYNQTWETDYLAVLVKDKIVHYRLSKDGDDQYKISGLFSVTQHTLPDPIKLM